MSIKIGDKVKIKNNAENTTWSDGVVVDINKEGYLIDFNYPLGVYGMGIRESKDNLEKIGSEPKENMKKINDVQALRKKAIIEKELNDMWNISLKAVERADKRGHEFIGIQGDNEPRLITMWSNDNKDYNFYISCRLDLSVFDWCCNLIDAICNSVKLFKYADNDDLDAFIEKKVNEHDLLGDLK